MRRVKKIIDMLFFGFNMFSMSTIQVPLEVAIPSAYGLPI
jgi:hypothetical protein